MAILNYLLYYGIIIPLSKLPFGILYGISDVLYFILFKVTGYRKKVVITNLKNSFPDKSDIEINQIASDFYRHLSDVIVESLKSFSISNEEISKRMILQNPELLNKFYNEGRSLILAGGHYNNWEWIATSLDQQINHQAIAIYKTLNNKFFDEKMRSTRGRFGLRMISTRKVTEVFEEMKNDLIAVVFAIDQSPSPKSKSYRMRFLNQDTAVLFGTEKYAKQYNLPVLFGSIQKVKRGYYTFSFVEVTSEPSITAYGEITEKITRLLEEQIIREPQYWLWTHKRWKKSRLETVVNN